MKRRLRRSFVVWVGTAAITLVVLGLVGCSSASVNTNNNNSDTTATASIAWTKDSDCSVCHKTEQASMSDSASSVSRHSSLKCIQCHTGESGLATAHDGATATSAMPTKLKDTKIDEKTCLGCHGSYAELAKKTAKSTALTDSEGTVVNPHAVPVNSEQSHNKITCSSCHDMHSKELKATTAMEVCENCHHQKVFQCHTCHE